MQSQLSEFHVVKLSSVFFHFEILTQASLKENQIIKLSHLEFSKMGEIIALVNATKYSRMDQVKFVEDSL